MTFSDKKLNIHWPTNDETNTFDRKILNALIFDKENVLLIKENEISLIEFKKDEERFEKCSIDISKADYVYKIDLKDSDSSFIVVVTRDLKVQLLEI